jgi:hypothetical protein
MTILILSGIIILVSGISFFVIRGLLKKNKALKVIQEQLETRIDFYIKNRQAYQAITDKLTKGRKDAEKIKETVNNSDGSDLADILNSL